MDSKHNDKCSSLSSVIRFDEWETHQLSVVVAKTDKKITIQRVYGERQCNQNDMRSINRQKD